MADQPPTTGPLAVLSQAKELWAKQPKGRKTLALALVGLVAAGTAWATLLHHGETWVLIAETASPDDTNQIYALLATHDLPERLRDGKVEVPSERLGEARALMAAQGLPNVGKGMELFDESGLGKTSFAEQVDYRRALEGELAHSIAAMSPVASARVHLALGKKSVFKEQEDPPTASVALHLHPGQTLSAEQVRGVRQLVAASVEGLKPEAVSLVDQRGVPLDAGDMTTTDRRADLERELTAKVRRVLETAVGVGKVAVVTTADVDDRKVNETEEVFDKNRTAVRSESVTLEGPEAAAGIGGIAGAQGNLPGSPGAGPVAGAGSAAGGKRAQTTNNEISRKVTQTVNAPGAVKKLHLAVVVDYKSVGGKATPRTPEEIKELTALAHNAAGIDDARGDSIELRSLAFAPVPDEVAGPAPAPDWTEMLPLPLPLFAAAAGGGLLVLLTIAALLVRRSRRKARAAAEAALPLALPAPLADIERVLDGAKQNLGLPTPTTPEEPALPPGPDLQDRVLTAVRNDVERAAAVLAAWLAEPPPNGAKP